MFKKILLPLDGSETAEAVLPQVRKLLKRENAEILLLTAVHFVPPPDGYVATLYPELRRNAEDYLARVQGRLEKEKIAVRSLVEDGPPASAILEVAKRENVALIAMSTHGRSGIARFLMGSVAEKVLRASPVPCFLHRSFECTEEGARRPAPATELELKNILLPLDGSDAALSALPVVAEFALQFNANVTVLGVAEPDHDREDDLLVEEYLREARERLRGAGVRVKTLLCVGDPATVILDCAKDKIIDMIAMATHGRSGVSRWVFGSVTEKVLRSAHLPMLVVRSTKKPILVV